MKKAQFRYKLKNYSVSTPESKKIILLISVGQAYHEEKYLLAAVNAINKEKFGFCTIALADSLQRHNYSHINGHESAYAIALKNGQDWLERNLSIINSLDIPFEIIHWDQWLADENYLQCQDAIDFAYTNDHNYKYSIDFTIDSFIERTSKRECFVDKSIDTLRSSCLQYLKEECAIIMPLWATLNYDYVIYPKPMTKAMETTHYMFVAQLSSKVKWLSINFK
ncbi:MAG TPA: hypothetical protein PK657_09990 [Legionella sp.]|nr:hypothetical protein [Legionella sp.]